MIKLVNLLNEILDKASIGTKHGEGGQHNVHNYGTDKVIKRAYRGGNIKNNENIKIFNEYPEIFPKIYDIGEKYIILEKLDDRKSQKELWEMKIILFSLDGKYVSNQESPKNSYIADLLRTSRYNKQNLFFYRNGSITEMIYENLEDNKLKSELQKELPSNLYSILIDNYYPLLKQIKNLPWSSKHAKDVNDTNFGYNSNGELKMLDI
jgi:hypothetical protein